MNECRNGKCEYTPSFTRKIEAPRKAKEVQYAKLWGEIVLPKQKAGGEFKW